MNQPTTPDHHRLARALAGRLGAGDREQVLAWLRGLLAISGQPWPVERKLAEALRLTRQSAAVWPAVRLLGGEIRRHGWDRRSWKSRLGLGAVIATLASVGSTGAGIAALGGAIGVPLWVVTGTGAAFAGALVDELAAGRPGAAADIVDAQIVDRDHLPPP